MNSTGNQMLDDKTSDFWTGRKHTDESRARMSAAASAAHKGKSWSIARRAAFEQGKQK